MNIGAAFAFEIFIAAAIFFQVSPGFLIINIRFYNVNDVYFTGSLYPDLTAVINNIFAGGNVAIVGMPDDKLILSCCAEAGEGSSRLRTDGGIQ